MQYDDIRFSGWDDPEDDNESGDFKFDDSMASLSFDAIGECQGCGVVGEVNGLQFCQWCMEEFEE